MNNSLRSPLFFGIGQAPLLADGRHEVHDIFRISLAHALAAVGHGVFHVPDFVLQGLGLTAGLQDILMAVGRIGDGRRIGPGIVVDFDIALIEGGHAPFRLLGMER